MYKPTMTQKETQKAIKLIKVFFEHELSERLNLTRVSAPLFVEKESGLNDDLNGVERPVSFDILDTGREVEIVQSLAKWKRKALKDYEFTLGEGLYTNMNAIRRDEKLDRIHSIYVDQWDWEKIIGEGDRNVETLKETVRIIYSIFKDAELLLERSYPFLKPILPESLSFITTQELLDRYPGMTPKERERAYALETGAYFLLNIGDLLSDGQRHDGRAPDYDDWSLNGDLLFFNPVHDDVLELSSMGIRVDRKTLLTQLAKAGKEDRMDLPFHRALLDGKLPQTMGGGIGQSRICQFLLHKYHIGEVQSSIWPDPVRKEAEAMGIALL
ncbi:aspartate--ammonia ligase [Proteiniclasticum sp. BAD-10]|uniref:Aspartate--ammonia ligase n=1 Tax=Proteiniclasticum sediminis TaxID=2804028 RepID=A0A941CUA2_9CLOT|nr:aspartate--ammonia ligase [Proteiniclasticum sediminis]MBR0577383.1 aspartate--ammonia ligase [Proteiniclasticum sediminis]